MKVSVRHISVLVAAAGFCGSIALAQDAVPVKAGDGVQVKEALPAMPVGPVPKIDFEQTTHQFGVISDEKVVEHRFKFTNSGQGNLEIVNLNGSCGCTVPQLEKKTYAPGESGEILVQYNPSNRRGKQHTNVTVTTNDPLKAQVILGVESEVKPTITTEPQVAALGSIERGKGGKATLVITSRKLDFVPMQITPNDAKVSAVIGERKEAVVDGDKVVQYPIEVTLSESAAVGPIQTQCVIRTNDPAKTMNFMVLGEVVGIVKAEPQRVTLGGLANGQDINTAFRITPRSGQDFKLLSAVEEPAAVPQPNNPVGVPGVKVFNIKVSEDTSTTPRSYVVSLSGKAPESAGTFRGDIVLKTDVPGEEVVKVPYYGFIRAKPQPVPGRVNPAGQPSSSSLLIPEN